MKFKRNHAHFEWLVLFFQPAKTMSEFSIHLMSMRVSANNLLLNLSNYSKTMQQISHLDVVYGVWIKLGRRICPNKDTVSPGVWFDHYYYGNIVCLWVLWCFRHFQLVLLSACCFLWSCFGDQVLQLHLLVPPAPLTLIHWEIAEYAASSSAALHILFIMKSVAYVIIEFHRASGTNIVTQPVCWGFYEIDIHWRAAAGKPHISLCNERYHNRL